MEGSARCVPALEQRCLVSSSLLFFRLQQLLVVPLLLVAAAAAGLGSRANCLEERTLMVSAEKLQKWGEKSAPGQLIAPTLRSRRGNGAVMLELKHHPRAPWPWTASAEDVLTSDEGRVSSIHARIKSAAGSKKPVPKNSAAAQVPLTSGIKLQTLNYITTIAVGGKNMTVIVDTGSDLTWVQCKPCFFCYSQQEPMFDPSASPSYQAVPCASTECSSLQPATGNTGTCGLDKSTCNYVISYGDGSYTRGVLARESINLGGVAVDSFVFGCGRSNHGLFGGTSGLMGLGRTQLSLVSQTTAQFGGVFSYCLPAHTLNSSGSLVLGDDPGLYKITSPLAYTRMVTVPDQAPFYFLNLTGMSVGGVALQAAGFSSGRILIDSGTVISRLVPSVYKALKAEFVKQFEGYPPAPSFSILDTCFDLSSYQEVKVPTVKMAFEGGAELTVDVTGIFFFVKKDASQVCLAVASLQYEDQQGIIGNYQQKNQRIVYDTMTSRIGFAEEVCS